MSQHPRQPPPPGKPMLRNLGEFFGHIVQGIKTPVDPPSQGPGPDQPPPPAAVRQIVEEREIQTPEGKVILRRTVIDEVRTEPMTPGPATPQLPRSET